MVRKVHVKTRKKDLLYFIYLNSECRYQPFILSDKYLANVLCVSESAASYNRRVFGKFEEWKYEWKTWHEAHTHLNDGCGHRIVLSPAHGLRKIIVTKLGRNFRVGWQRAI